MYRPNLQIISFQNVLKAPQMQWSTQNNKQSNTAAPAASLIFV